jgi:hypothetical protein
VRMEPAKALATLRLNRLGKGSADLASSNLWG